MNSDKHPGGFKRARKKAESMIDKDSKIKELINNAMEKLKGTSNKRILEIKSDIQALIRMLHSWKKGIYKEVPKNTIIYALAAIIYFVNPFDLIFDYIPFLGFLDDATIFGFVINSIRSDIQKFKSWEEGTSAEEKTTT